MSISDPDMKSEEPSPTGEFPNPFIPTVYADGVLNLARAPGLVKFYLARNDPSLTGDVGFKPQAIAQVVMSMNGFIEASIFFERALREFIDTGIVPKDLVDKIRAGFEEQESK